MSASIEVGRHQDDAELSRLEAIQSDAFVWPLERIRPYLEMAGLEHVRVVRVGGKVAGGLVLLPSGQWFGGNSVPTSGVAAVAVSPEYRAQGVALRLMESVIRELHAAGTPISSLWPATQTLYRRAGYEVAGMNCEVNLPASAITVRERGEVRAATGDDEADIRRAYAQWAQQTSGNLDRSEFHWRRVHVLRDQPTRGFVVGAPGQIEGYAFVLPEAVAPLKHELRVHDIVALTPAGATRLLTLLADYRSVRERVLWRCGPCDPLLALLPESPYVLTCRGPWMLRIVHVRKALEARGYPAGVTAVVEFDVKDETVSANNGRVTLRVERGRAVVEPGGRGLFEIHVRGLAALYSGYFPPQNVILARLGTAPPEQIAAAAAIFAGPTPWMRDAF